MGTNWREKTSNILRKMKERIVLSNVDVISEPPVLTTGKREEKHL